MIRQHKLLPYDSKQLVGMSYLQHYCELLPFYVLALAWGRNKLHHAVFPEWVMQASHSKKLFKDTKNRQI